MNNFWNPVVYDLDKNPIEASPLRKLLDGEYPVVVLKGLLSEQRLKEGVDRISRLYENARITPYVNGSLTLIGTFLVKHLSDTEKYFHAAKEADERALAAGLDLAGYVRGKLREVLNLDSFEVATEPDGRAYASSNVRICKNTVDTPLHNDNIMRDGAAADIVLAGLKHQLSCVVCLQGPVEGGELSIYRKPWEPDDEVYKVSGGLGYDLGVVEGKEHCRFRPQSGDVYLLNPTYHHAVERVYGNDRITLGFFFGFFDDRLKDGVTWV
jgi:hypothetical protein